MLHHEPLDSVPLWGLFLATVGLIYGAIEVGYALGKYRRRVAETERETTIGPIVGATMGLLAFMLGFTFSMAASRFDARRQMVVEEANAIGTTYLRSGLLAEPQRAEVRTLLHEYIDIRLEASQPQALAHTLTRSSEIHQLLWEHAEKTAVADPYAITTGLFIQSLNNIIDLHAKRVMIGLRSRIPLIIWLVLYLLALLSMAQLGYHAGLTASRRSLAGLVLVCTFSIVILLIADLDRQHEGLVHVSQQAMIDLRDSLKAKLDIAPTR